MFFYIFIVFLLTFFLLSYKYLSRNYDYWKKKKINFVKPLPFIGCMWPSVSLQISPGEIFAKLYNQMNEDFFGIYIFDRPTLIIKSPKLIKNILTTNFDYFRNRTMTLAHSDAVLSKALFLNTEPSWKNLRTKLTPAYSTGKMKLLFNVIMKDCELMIDYIKQNCINASSTEVKDFSTKYTSNFIGRTTFGIEANCFQNENAEFRKIGRILVFGSGLSGFVRQASSFFLPAITKLFDMSLVDTKSKQQLAKIFKDIVNQRIQMTSGKLHMIDILLDYHRNNDELFTDEMVIAQSFQFYMAQNDSVSNTLAFALYELAMNPDVQNKLRKELQDSGSLTYETMNLKYLDMVISETLRKYPFVPFLDRTCQSDYQIPGTDIILNKGTGVYIPVLALHFDEKYFPNPQQFLPERFAVKSKINENGFYYLPFGEGPRNCIGMVLGRMTCKLAVAKIVLNYRVQRCAQTPDRIEYDPKGIFAVPKFDIPIKFETL